MRTGKLASGTLLTLFLIGLAVGLFLVVTGHGIASDYMGKGGGGLAVLLGWGLAAAGYLTLAFSIFGAGLPWVAIATKSKKQSTRNNESDEGDPK